MYEFAANVLACRGSHELFVQEHSITRCWILCDRLDREIIMAHYVRNGCSIGAIIPFTSPFLKIAVTLDRA